MEICWMSENWIPPPGVSGMCNVSIVETLIG